MGILGVLTDKVAIVTGGGHGEGKDACLALAKAGARVAIVDIDEAAATSVAHQVEHLGAQALALRCDSSDAAEIIQAVHDVVDWFGTVDILVNNAQAATADIAFEDMTDADFEMALATGPEATFRFMRACHPHLVGGGHVLTLGHGANFMTLPESVVQEWAWQGISIHCPAAGTDAALIPSYAMSMDRAIALAG